MNIEENLKTRSNSSCELCESTKDLTPFNTVPESEPAFEKSVLLCQTCLKYFQNPDPSHEQHWRCLNTSVWSQVPAVQVVIWRILKSHTEKTWAQDLLENLYIDDEILNWAKAGFTPMENDDIQVVTKDSNGATLSDGDSVTLIKDLDVKGANFTAKRGTLVKNISLTSNPQQIEGRVNGTQIVLLTRFLKKA